MKNISKKLPKFIPTISGNIEDIGPGKNKLILKKSSINDTGTYKNLKIIEYNDINIQADPYNNSCIKTKYKTSKKKS